MGEINEIFNSLQLSGSTHCNISYSGKSEAEKQIRELDSSQHKFNALGNELLSGLESSLEEVEKEKRKNVRFLHQGISLSTGLLDEEVTVRSDLFDFNKPEQNLLKFTAKKFVDEVNNQTFDRFKRNDKFSKRQKKKKSKMKKKAHKIETKAMAKTKRKALKKRRMKSY
eukprot:snap_masked-scaffold_7-processed-gene-8.33-mRNA-1 protein AED:1.00 eAED:1.00 QI:0/-1/0/0/-1/1/1/0/168